EGAEAGHFSFHAAAIDAGLIKQPAIIGNGSQNASKRTAYAIWKATRSSPLDGPMPLTAPDMPDLQAAIAEWEAHAKEQKQGADSTLKRDPAPAPAPPAPEPPPSPAPPAMPCTSCSHPQASAALREICNVYLAACRGEPHQTGSTLPHACCQRLLHQRPD